MRVQRYRIQYLVWIHSFLHTCYVPGLWHIDGHHSLIRWGLVVHGGIDGFSRLGYISSNTAPVVWSSLRSDKGRENIGV